QAVAQKQPQDPAALTNVALVLEKLKRAPEAAGVWVAVADLYLMHKSPRQAVEAWQKAAALEPDRSDVHQRLVEVYEREGKRALAAKEYLALAYVQRRRGDRAKAISFAERAVAVDPRNQEAAAFIKEMQVGEAPVNVSVPSQVGEAEKAALTRLAETLLGERAAPRELSQDERHDEQRPALDQSEIDALIARAVDAQTRHRVSEAIEAYRKLIVAGVVRAEVRFNLGLLYLETMRYDEAVELLDASAHESNYQLASHFALGQCFRAQGKMDQAVEHYLQVLKIVDLGNVRRDQADELIAVYESLAESYAAKGDREHMESFASALEEFLGSKGWEDKLSEARAHLDAIRMDDGQVNLADVPQVSDSERILEALAVSQEYMRRGKLLAATEECFRAIQLAPNYLPAHVRLAEILVKQNRLDAARAKYEMLAELSVVRGERERAEQFYRGALNIDQGNVSNRSRLVDLLVQQNKTNDALEQYLALGDVYVRSGQFAKAIERFGEGIRFAGRGSVAGPLVMNLRHRFAETRVRQGDLKGALSTYLDIRQQSPDDERAHFYAIDLQMRLGQTDAALRDLDALLARYQSRGESPKVVGVLEALAQAYPNELGLTQRLMQGYATTGARDKAVAMLDALGEQQLGVGNRDAAIETIRHIIALNPPRVQEYQK
ncbi:MAG: tetratricopeptide repeat protein, partial [Chloroflexi bacterium]|nr:tetratricopeptide repeat protein [Chloroflexota bacterium]